MGFPKGNLRKERTAGRCKKGKETELCEKMIFTQQGMLKKDIF
jgi:hypothetical protein